MECKQQNKQEHRRTRKNGMHQIEQKSKKLKRGKEETDLERALRVRYSNLGRRMKLRGERWGNRPGVFGDDPGGGTAEVAVPASDIGGANKNLKNIERMKTGSAQN